MLFFQVESKEEKSNPNSMQYCSPSGEILAELDNLGKTFFVEVC